MVSYLLMTLLILMAIVMILLVLVQRGKGGGLVGALGGMGGESALGTRAGDLFTRITMWTAFFWIVLCAFTVRHMSQTDTAFEGFGANRPAQVEEVTAPPTGEDGS